MTFLHACRLDPCPAQNNPRIVALSVIQASAEHLRQTNLKPS